jgi:hypothetical protein
MDFYVRRTWLSCANALDIYSALLLTAARKGDAPNEPIETSPHFQGLVWRASGSSLGTYRFRRSIVVLGPRYHLHEPQF